MKNSNYKLLKVTLVLVLFILSSKSYSQEKFTEINLVYLQNIALNSNINNFKNYMKESDYILYSETTNFCSYIHKYGTKVQFYVSNNKIKGVSISDLTTETTELIAINLKENKFIEVLETGGRRFSKKSYPFNFFIHEAIDCRASITAYPNK